MGLYVFDHARRLIADAEVEVEGKPARYDALYQQYLVERAPAARARLAVRHPDFEPLVEDAFPWLSQRVYLHRPGDSYYCADGVKVACLPCPELIFVALRPLDPQVGAWRSPDQAQAALRRICSDLDLVVRHSGVGRGKNAASDPQRCDPQRYIHVLAGQNQQPLPASESEVLAALRVSPEVQAAGPLLTHTADFSELAALSHFVVVVFQPQIPEAEARGLLQAQGFSAEPQLAFHDAHWLRVPLDLGCGLAAAQVAVRLATLPQVVTASNEVITFEH